MFEIVLQSHYWMIAGWTMLHFLWIGGIAGLLAVVGRVLLRSAPAESRYLTGLICLGLLAAAPVGIFGYLSNTMPASVSSEPTIVETSSDEAFEALKLELVFDAQESQDTNLDTSAGLDSQKSTEILVPAALVNTPPMSTGQSILAAVVSYSPLVWLIGTPVVFLLMATGLIGADRLRKNADRITDGSVFDLATSLAESLKVTKEVSIGISRKIASPVLVGIIRPMILLPPVALTGWSPEQIEMVLLHELAHVRRWDNLINLIQRAIEALLFFHPAVWLISRWIRLEREHCCDAIVLSRGGSPKSYAEMLFSLASSPKTEQVAVAMSQNDVVPRIRRILQLQPVAMKYSRMLIAMMAVAAIGVSVGACVSANQKAVEEGFEIIIDADDPNVSWVGPWIIKEVYHGSDCRTYGYATSGKGESRVTFTPDLPVSGVYEVYARWPGSPDCTGYADYRIRHRDGEGSAVGNQTKNSWSWNLLGSAWFDKGTGGSVTVTNRVPGYESVFVAVDKVKFKYVGSSKSARPSFQSEPELQLDAEDLRHTLALTVVDEQTGKPLPGVHLTMYLGRNSYPWREMKTNQDGQCLIPKGSAQPKYFRITTHDQQYAPTILEWDTLLGQDVPDQFKLSLQPGSTIGGRLTDEEGRPVEGARVRFRSLKEDNPSEDVLFREWIEDNVLTDSNGQWTCSTFPPDSTDVEVGYEHPEYVNDDRYADRTPPPMARLRDLSWVDTIKRGIALEGKVVDSSGKPVPGAKIIRGRRITRRPGYASTTNQDGHYRIAGVPPGEHDLTIVAKGHAPHLERLDFQEKKPPREFQLNPSNMIWGRVVDVLGDPITGVLVKVEKWRDRETLSWVAYTDSEGQFVWKNAPEDEVRFLLKKEGYLEKSVSVSPNLLQEQVFELLEPKSIKGKVTDAETGRSVPEFFITPGTKYRGISKPVWSGVAKRFTGGTYTFPCLERYNTVMIESPGYLPVISDMPDRKSGTIELDMALHPGSQLKGRVVYPDGKPVIGVKVGAVSDYTQQYIQLERFFEPEMGMNLVNTDHLGRFALPPQEDGYRIVCLADQGYAAAFQQVFEKTGVITFYPWGRIEGVKMTGDTPAVNEQVMLEYVKDNPVGLKFREVWTDRKGRFVFEKVLAGQVTMYKQHGGGFRPCMKCTVKSGETTELVIGFEKSSITGSVSASGQLLDSVTPESISFSLRRKDSGQASGNKKKKRGWLSSILGAKQKMTAEKWSRLQKRKTIVKMKPDRTFRIDDVKAGDYVLEVLLFGPPNGDGIMPVIAGGSIDVVVPKKEDRQKRRLLDVGQVSLTAGYSGYELPDVPPPSHGDIYIQTSG